MNIRMIRDEGPGNTLWGPMAGRDGKDGKKDGGNTTDLGNVGQSSLGRSEFYFVQDKP